MDQMQWQRWGALSAYAALVLGVAGGAMELALSRPWPAAGDPAYGAFLLVNRGPILTQSLLFVVSSAIYLWFLGALRRIVGDAEGRDGWLAAVAFGAGVTWAAMNIVGQAPQIALTLPSARGIQPGVAGAVADLCLVMLALANLPLAVLLASVAVVWLRSTATARWLGWLSVAAAGAAVASALAVVPTGGPLSGTGWLTTLLRFVPALWFLATATAMLRLSGRPPTAMPPDDVGPAAGTTAAPAPAPAPVDDRLVTRTRSGETL